MTDEEIIQKAKEDLLRRTDIAASHAEMAVLNTFLRRCLQMGWLSQYDPIQVLPIGKDDNRPINKY